MHTNLEISDRYQSIFVVKCVNNSKLKKYIGGNYGRERILEKV